MKKEKHESKKTATPVKEPKDTLSPSLVDLALVSVVGVVDGQSTVKSPSLSALAEKRKKVEKEKASTSKSVKPTDKPAKSSSESRPAKASTNARIDELDQKWSDRFNLLDVLLLAKTLDRPQELTFQTIKVATTHSPPASVVRSTERFIKPANPPLLQSTDQPTTSDLHGTDPPAAKQQSTSKS